MSKTRSGAWAEEIQSKWIGGRRRAFVASGIYYLAILVTDGL